MAQSYIVEATQKEGIERVLGFAEHTLGMERKGNPDIITLRYSVCSVEQARKVLTYANQSGLSGQKLIILATERLFHQAQNALLKIFEEPPTGTTMVLIVPSLGMLLPTLRSRLIPLPNDEMVGKSVHVPEIARAFMSASPTEREKIVRKLLDRSKSDKDTEKQSARVEAQMIVAGITEVVHDRWRKTKQKEDAVVLSELATFSPMLFESSAPLKLIFEHVLLTVPKL